MRAVGTTLVVCLVSLAACGTPRIRTHASSSDPELFELLKRLRQQSSADFMGGLSREELALAQAFADHAFRTGVRREICENKERIWGVISSGDASTVSGRSDENPVLDALEQVVRSGNRKQRAVALVAIARIGPGAGFSVEFLQGRGPWSRDALTAVSCERWTPPDVVDMWGDEPSSREAAVDRMIDQMLNKNLMYPVGVFGHSLSNRGYGDVLTLEQARRLLPLLMDEGYADSIRAEAIDFVAELAGGRTKRDGEKWTTLKPLRGHETIFEGPLLNLYESETPELAGSAGFALVRMRSKHGADVLADSIESRNGERWRWPGLFQDCEAFAHSQRLGRLLVGLVSSPVETTRIAAIQTIGCLHFRDGVPALLDALEQPFWSQQEAVVKTLAQFNELPRQAMSALEEIAKNHWSSIVREAADEALVALRGLRTRDELEEIRWGFHRQAVRHGLPVCHGETPGDGLYAFAGAKPFAVKWNVAKVHDIPEGFPIKLDEMRSRKGYGTNTFLRQSGGWLYSTDLWHYDGVFGFVTEDGKVQKFGPESAHAAFIIETQFGITALGDDVFGSGDGGVLAVLERDEAGKWTWQTMLEMPSEAFAYAFAPDGTLLVRDPFGAVAITRESEILPLNCA